MILNRKQIKKEVEKGLVEDYPHLETQLQPNGFDITVGEIHRFKEPGRLDFSNSEREIPETEKIEPERKNKEDDYRWWKLQKGSYKIKTNERFNMPNDLAGIVFPRSSLLRMGCTTETGVWDAGFSGKAEFILMVMNEEVEIKENARVAQLLFVTTEEVEDGYRGVYGE